MNEVFARKLCWTIDARGYGQGNDVEQATLQEELNALVTAAAAAAGLRRETWLRQPGGDGELALVPDDEPEHWVIDRLTTELATLLDQRNRRSPAEKRLAVRVAVNHGLVKMAVLGWAGSSVVEVCRLRDSEAAKAALERIPGANVVLMLSHHLFQSMVLGGHTSVTPASFLRVRVEEKEFREDAWIWVPGVDMGLVRQALAGLEDRSAAPRGNGFDAVVPEVRRLQDALVDRTEDDPGIEHTFDVFRKMVEVVDAHSPITVYGGPIHVALAYVLVQSWIASGHTGNELTGPVQCKRDLDLLAPVAYGVSAMDIDLLAQLFDQVSLVEPGRIKKVAGLGKAPAARCFSLLWGLGALAQGLDNPGLLDATLPVIIQPKGNVIDLAHGLAKGYVQISLATKDQTGFHLAAEAHHSVRRFFAELEDVWRRSHLIPPTVRFELSTPNWIRRSLQVHDIRVDPGPITRLLMGRDLYGNREHVWLRELLQNAMDAVGLGGNGDASYVPRIDVELENPHRVIVRDNGVGMTRQQVLTQLTVLGRSGWRNISAAENSTGGSEFFFGRFGIGFASVFSAASSVQILTRTVDTQSADGTFVEFAEPDSPFYTDFVACPVGTEIRVTLINPMDESQFREAMSDLFAYLPPSVHVSPDPKLPTSLADYSPAKRGGWHRDQKMALLSRSGTTVLGAYKIGFKIELLYNVAPIEDEDRTSAFKFNSAPYGSMKYCVDGVRVNEQPGQGNPVWRDRPRLKGCHLVVDFARDNAPVMASRNALDFGQDLLREIKQLMYREVGAMLPKLAAAVQRTSPSGRVRSDVIHRSLWYLMDIQSRPRRFHVDADLGKALIDAYYAYCPIQVMCRDGSENYRPLREIDPNECSVVILRKLTTHPIFPMFVRVAGLSSWFVVAHANELMVFEAAWSYDTPLDSVTSERQLFQNFQAVLPEIREGTVFSLLRADFALAEGAAFRSRLCLSLPGGGAVPREVALVTRRSATSPNERPKTLFNREHEVIRAIEAHAEKTGGMDSMRLRDWLDRFCKDVLDERRKRSVRAIFPQLLDELTNITGVQFHQISPDNIWVSHKDVTW
jgi:cell wall assembly regulator SMI1